MDCNIQPIDEILFLDMEIDMMLEAEHDDFSFLDYFI